MIKATVEFETSEEVICALRATEILLAISEARETLRSQSKHQGKIVWSYEEIYEIFSSVFSFEHDLLR